MTASADPSGLPPSKHASSDGNELERQVTRGQLFTHTALSQHTTRILEIEAFLYGLIDVLVERGLATPKELENAVREVRSQLGAKRDRSLPLLVLRVDSEEASAPRFVNCAERMPICKAVCCRLDFALSRREIESGRVRWDLGRPYFIRQRADGYCHHNQRGTGRCGVYADRPAVCRHYSCRDDKRIWKDFEKMELNEEWLTAHLVDNDHPRLVDALMHPGEQLVVASDCDPEPSVTPTNPTSPETT